MENAKITQTIVHYLAKNHEDLEGAMASERFFMVVGKSIGDARADPRIKKGYAIDVLADMIEKGDYFGEWVPNEVEQATNCNNARLVMMRPGGKLIGKFEVNFDASGNLYVVPQVVAPKDYLNIIRTDHGFKQSAELLGVEGDLDRIVSNLYSSD